jgi:DNA-binding NarL/FixJ family response regulator
MKRIKIAVADDQAIFRTGFVSMLNNIPGIQVVVEAEDGAELIEKLRAVKVHIVFLDYRMPNMNGAAASKIIRANYPDTRVLFLSMYDDEEFVTSAIENGTNGYLTKDDSPEEILKAIESVMNTGFYMNDRTSKVVVRNMVLLGKIRPRFARESDDLPDFTTQELTVIGLICREYSTKEIAEIMKKAERTIEGYRAEIMKKTGTRNSVGIVMYAVKYGIVDWEGNVVVNSDPENETPSDTEN